MLADIGQRKDKIQEGPEWVLRENDMGPFWNLRTWGSEYIE